MTFVAAFYNFSIELNNPDSGTFASFRLKLPRHELESRDHFYARLIAYLHSYCENLRFCDSNSNPKLPTIWLRDTIDTVMLWIDVGTPDKRKLELSLKQNARATHRVYFYQEQDITQFCHHLRGSKTNWVKDVECYQIETQLLCDLETQEQTSPNWSVSFIDDRVYLTIDGRDFESTLARVDIWDAFQASLQAVE
jgi:uncharacterized protein YaeQ